MLVLVLAAGLTFAAPQQGGRDELREAAAEVQRETRGKILSARTVNYGRQRLHRIKVLTEEGRVQVRTVPSRPGSGPPRTELREDFESEHRPPVSGPRRSAPRHERMHPASALDERPHVRPGGGRSVPDAPRPSPGGETSGPSAGSRPERPH